MARLQASAEFFNVAMQETAEATRAVLIETAKREHGKLLRDTGGRPLPFTRTVDGRKDAPEEAVGDFGVIQYDYHRLEEVVAFAMQILFDFSPVLSGEYRRSHTLFINRASVPNMKSWKTGDDVVILNPVLYARKIEQGRMKMRVPGSDHVYERATLAVNRRYGNVARARFGYRGVNEMSLTRNTTSAALRQSIARRTGADAREMSVRRRASATLAVLREQRLPALVFDEYA